MAHCMTFLGTEDLVWKIIKKIKKAFLFHLRKFTKWYAVKHCFTISYRFGIIYIMICNMVVCTHWHGFLFAASLHVCAGLVICCAVRRVQLCTIWHALIRLWSRCPRRIGCAVCVVPIRSRVSPTASLNRRGVVYSVARSPSDMIAMPGNTGFFAGESSCRCFIFEKLLLVIAAWLIFFFSRLGHDTFSQVLYLQLHNAYNWL